MSRVKETCETLSDAFEEGELGMMETKAAELVRDMEASIARSQAFIEETNLLGGTT